MRKKLSNWKANNLSLAGRITLAQSCLSSIPSYLMQTATLPLAICEEAESICRKFVWGSSDSRRRCHLISWEKICQPKDQWGLGFRNLKILNKAYMSILAWQLINNPERLWVQITKIKYKCGPIGMPTVTNKPNASNTWRSIVNSWQDVAINTPSDSWTY